MSDEVSTAYESTLMALKTPRRLSPRSSVASFTEADAARARLIRRARGPSRWKLVVRGPLHLEIHEKKNRETSRCPSDDSSSEPIATGREGFVSYLQLGFQGRLGCGAVAASALLHNTREERRLISNIFEHHHQQGGF
jgi:hypothetical protein